jgi:hypothetical protein
MWHSGHYYVSGSTAISAASFVSLASLGRLYFIMDMGAFSDRDFDSLTWPNKIE